mgnify:FL=1
MLFRSGELKSRAEAWVTSQNEKLTARYKELGVSDEVAAMEGLDPALLVKLGEKGVKSLDDLGDLASDEFRDIVGKDAFDEEEANKIIMAARAHWFADEAKGAE